MAFIDGIKEREAKWQERWANEAAFESIPDGREKFFCTFPYPYVNGLPHIGHLFTIMRVEAFARYHRLLGKNVLFPQGWHATGSPIVAAANRVKEGEEKQIRILKDFGVPEDEITSFAAPEHWIEYFVPRYRKDLTSVGLSIDWRRSFTTTSLNPHYDKFIRWQFAKLKEKACIEQGSHPVVWCPKDECPVGDHDRLSGEGETPQEFLLVKHRLDDGRFVVSATLRPDTILGVTNLYVNPKTAYKEIAIAGERWIVSQTAAERLREQDHELEITGDVPGGELIGKEVLEFAGNTVPILPATFLDPHFGTGLVHSVPSDSADDLIALRDLQKDTAMLKRHGLDIARIGAIEPIPVLETPGYGGIPAQRFLDEYKVKDQNDRKKLDEIRQRLYKLSFYEAAFNDKYERFGLAGKKVPEGKEKVQQEIIAAGWGATYYQLTGKVVCRCQTESVVRMVNNQWFLSYNKEEWKAQVNTALAQLRLYPEKARPQFEHVVGWLRQWACTREQGLGTRLPWDEQWLIESLSDSTIYMAYYTVSHKITEIDPAQLDEAFFDYLYLGKGKRPDVPGIDALREEFLYWYPLDFRNSGKDLIQNHLTFMLFNHCAIFPQEHWPQAIGVNGWVTVNGQKMSKSLGNVIPVRQLVAEFGADAARVTILNGGEGMDDPNWDSNFARGMLSRLEALVRQANEMPEGDETHMDAWIEHRRAQLIKDITAAMDETNFRTAIQLALFEYNQALRWYVQRVDAPNGELFRRAFRDQLVMLSPFIPHACEEAWEALGEEGFVSLAPWPVVDESSIDPALDTREDMVREIAEQIRRLKEKGTGTALTLSLAADWKREAYRQFDTHVATTRHPGELLQLMATGDLAKHGDDLKRLVLFLVKSRTQGSVPTAEDERAWMDSARAFLEDIAGCPITVLDAGEGEGKKKDAGLPGRPAVEFS